MTETQKTAFDFYCNEIDTWNWLGVMSKSDPETITELRTQFLHMAHLLQSVINEQLQKESTICDGLSEANAV